MVPRILNKEFVLVIVTAGTFYWHKMERILSVAKVKTKISVTLLLLAVAILAVGVIDSDYLRCAVNVGSGLIVVARCFGVSWQASQKALLNVSSNITPLYCSY